MSTHRHSPAAMMAAQAVCLIHLHTKDRKTVSQVAGTIESFYPAPGPEDEVLQAKMDRTLGQSAAEERDMER